MGLKKQNYTVPDLGVTVENAYAICTNVFSNRNAEINAQFQIYTSREHAYAEDKQALATEAINFVGDKNQPLWEQAYTEAKATIFQDWEDDIPNDAE